MKTPLTSEHPSVPTTLPHTNDTDWLEQLHDILSIPVTEEIQKYFHAENDLFSFFYTPFLQFTYQSMSDYFMTFKTDMALIERQSLLQSTLTAVHHRLFHLTHRTLISEMHIDKLTVGLNGSTPHERYMDFNHKFNKTSKSKNLFNIYPILGKIVVNETLRTINFVKKIIQYYMKDYLLLSDFFKEKDLRLTNLQLGVGDTHVNGQCVTILTFASGQKVVYKPRSLSIDKQFGEFIEWVNSKGFQPSLRIPIAIDRQTYGWYEFIPHQEATSEDEIERYYSRIGGYLAIAYLFGATDLHLDNLIACGEHPMLIDLETLFTNDLDCYDSAFPFPALARELTQSVFGTLMLPITIASGKLLDIDLSAVGGGKGVQSEKIKTWVIVNQKTDEMKLVEQPYVTESSQNKPTVNGKEANIGNYIPHVTDGFRKMYRLFLNEIDELMDHNGPIFAFESCQIRHVFRATHVYAKFLEASTHPDYLQEPTRRNKLFESFWNITSLMAPFKKIVPHEIAELENHDIPYFVLTCGGTIVKDGYGRDIADLFQSSCIERVTHRLQQLGSEDEARQIRYIKSSLATLTNGDWTPSHEKTPMSPASADREDGYFLREAQAIGDDILAQLIWEDDRHAAYLIGVSVGMNEAVTVSPLTPGIYDGTLGIVLFFDQLAQQTGETHYRHAADALLEGMFKQLKPELMPSSAYFGLGSLFYGLMVLGLQRSDSHIIQKAYEYLKHLEECVQHEETPDFVSGLSGVLYMLTKIYQLTNEPRVFEVAKTTASRLSVLLDSKQPDTVLTGLSHGAAGFALALLTYGTAANDEQLLKQGHSYLVYERNRFNKQENNWVDLRKGNAYQTFWCHGAPGIGISRLLLAQFYDDELLHEELNAALNKTISDGFGHNHSLCHGDFGNLDLLLLYAQYTNNPEPKELARKLAISSIDQAHTYGWKLGLNHSDQLQGMMLGVTGIGYQLLRHINPTVPSILALELPSSTLTEKELRIHDR
ncbi:type 2 lanthipeptide synthetase LanM family protein [Halalkalibacterium halodurans]|uniref:Lantibiotic biosynthesis protein dehydration domain-containing protein n=1 Tax=Halalkalibacterium halodurans TaxID=86665 RepID=A0A0M0KDQ8_ALKHA|nr:type 2 lanthipeptide synthetase LanM [Halalkalibacterium halodurans]TPE69769.1 type 2 lantipeptide synthetase LanM [Halalkalibacterium halodurans]